MAHDEKNGGLIHALSLCRKAGALVTGFDACVAAARKGTAKLVLFAADASEKTKKNVRFSIDGACPALDMPACQADLLPITKKAVAVYAVMNEDLAALCIKNTGGATHDTQGGKTFDH